MTLRCVLMGVSGCGKTSVGTDVAEQLNIRFIDGDALHPKSNIAKMSAGQPLNDGDRAPWLRDVGRALATASAPTIIGCSALKRIYRDWIRAEAAGKVCFLHLHADKAVLADRVNSREGHFMPPALLDSQFATLEHLQADETGQVIDIARPLSQVIEMVQRIVKDDLP